MCASSRLLSFQFYRDLFHERPTEVLNNGVVGVGVAIQRNVKRQTRRPGNDDVVLSKIRKANGQDLVRIDRARVVRHYNPLAITFTPYAVRAE